MWHRRRKQKNNPKNSGHFVPQQCLRAAHALHSDQFTNQVDFLNTNSLKALIQSIMVNCQRNVFHLQKQNKSNIFNGSNFWSHPKCSGFFKMMSGNLTPVDPTNNIPGWLSQQISGGKSVYLLPPSTFTQHKYKHLARPGLGSALARLN